MVGGSVEFFLLLGTVQAALVHWARLHMPVLIGPFYLGLVVVMAYELSRDVLRASLLVQELQVSEAGLRESEARMSLAVDAGDFGIWTWDLRAERDLGERQVARVVWFRAVNAAGIHDVILQRLHPDDRDGLRQAIAMATAGIEWIPIPGRRPRRAAGWFDALDRVRAAGSRPTPAAGRC